MKHMSSKGQKIFPTWYDYNHIKTNHITHPMKIGWCSIYHNANNIVLFGPFFVFSNFQYLELLLYYFNNREINVKEEHLLPKPVLPITQFLLIFMPSQTPPIP